MEEHIVKKIKIDTKGVRNILERENKLTDTNAIFEYIWNGFDSGGDIIEVNYNIQSDIITDLTVKDNGSGINYEKLSKKFEPIYNSEKKVKFSNENRRSLPHGNKGIGRLSFFLFCNKVQWITVYYDKKENKKYKYTIEMISNDLQEYKLVESKKEVEIDKKTGTMVKFGGFEHKKILKKLGGEEYYKLFIEELKKEFCALLELKKNNNFKIKVNNKTLDYSNLIGEDKKKKIEIGGHEFKLKFIRWSESIKKEKSRYYIINTKNDELVNSTTGSNNQADNFFCSIYINSEYFDEFDLSSDKGNLSLIGQNFSSTVYKKFLDKLKKFIEFERELFIREKESYAKIKQLEEKKILPKYNKENKIESYQYEELVENVRILYIIEPTLFSKRTNEKQKRMMIGLIKGLLDENRRDTLLGIFEKILHLNDDQLKMFEEQIHRNSLNRIIKTINLIENRTHLIEKLRKVLFDKKKETLEKEIQKLIENNLWIFGEEFNLILKENKNMGVLIKEYHKLNGISQSKKLTGEETKKKVDLLISKEELINKDKMNNLVIELKRPAVPLGKKEVEQIKEYSKIISKIDSCKGDNMYWRYILIGNDYDGSNEVQELHNNLKHKGDNGLIHAPDEKKKIYVFRWTELLIEVESRLNWLRKELEEEKNTKLI